MKIRRGLILLCVAAIVPALAWLVFAKPKEPHYDGKPLSFWLDQLNATNPYILEKIKSLLPPGAWASPSTGPIIYLGEQYGSTNGLELKAALAIRNLHTNCLPFLLQRIQAYDTRLKRFVMLQTFQRRLVKWIPFKSNDPARWQAMAAFRILGSNAAPAMPAITALATNSNPDIQRSAKYVLAQYHLALTNAVVSELSSVKEK
jgi:hypothetical protein